MGQDKNLLLVSATCFENKRDKKEEQKPVNVRTIHVRDNHQRMYQAGAKGATAAGSTKLASVRQNISERECTSD